MTTLNNPNNWFGQALNSYDPPIWRKDVNVIAEKFPEYIVFDPANAENYEKIVETMFWKNIYSRTRP